MADMDEMASVINEMGEGDYCVGCEDPLPGGGLCEECEERLRMIDRALGGSEWIMEVADD